MWRTYTFNDLQASLKLLLRNGSHFVHDKDHAIITETLALIDSLTKEECLKPKLVLECRSRWFRALRGSGARNVSRNAVKYWLRTMSAVINEFR